MYIDFYHLKAKPFQISSDPAFLWLGEKHKEGLATLKYGILDNRGFLLLTGDVGTGKTTLINTVLGSLSDTVLWAFVPDPSLERLEFFNYIANGFGMIPEFTSKGSFLLEFGRFLRTAYAENKKVLLIIDEAQLLTQELLEEIRLLSNIERADTKLLTIFFVGQVEFNGILAKTQNRALRQRITINYTIETLNLEETSEYVTYRLGVAGTKKMIFTPDAIQAIYRHSQGFPRRINVICDHALISGYVKERRQIDGSIIDECAKEVTISAREIKQDVYDLDSEQQNGKEKTLSSDRQVEAGHRTRTATTGRKLKHKKKPVKRNYRRTAIVLCLCLLIAGICLVFSEPVRDWFEEQELLTTLTLPIVPGIKGNTLTSGNTVEKQESAQSIASPDNVSVYSPDSDGSKILPLETDGPGSGASSPESSAESFQVRNVPDLAPLIVGDAAPLVTNGLLPQETQAATALSPKPVEKIIVRFKTNTTEVKDRDRRSLDEFITTLGGYPRARIHIIGYTDLSGYSAINFELSEHRASIIKDYLVEKGIAPQSITVEGRGSNNPVASNETFHGRELNRRVEIEVFQEE